MKQKKQHPTRNIPGQITIIPKPECFGDFGVTSTILNHQFNPDLGWGSTSIHLILPTLHPPIWVGPPLPPLIVWNPCRSSPRWVVEKFFWTFPSHPFEWKTMAHSPSSKLDHHKPKPPFCGGEQFHQKIFGSLPPPSHSRSCCSRPVSQESVGCGVRGPWNVSEVVGKLGRPKKWRNFSDRFLRNSIFELDWGCI